MSNVLPFILAIAIIVSLIYGIIAAIQNRWLKRDNKKLSERLNKAIRDLETTRIDWAQDVKKTKLHYTLWVPYYDWYTHVVENNKLNAAAILCADEVMKRINKQVDELSSLIDEHVMANFIPMKVVLKGYYEAANAIHPLPIIE